MYVCYSVVVLLLVGITQTLSVELPGSFRPEPEKACYGTSMVFGFSGSREFHYEIVRRRYTGCTYVHGNLEVTNLYNGNVSYDLSFLSTIKVVTGYVLLGLINTEVIPLTSLRHIRGDRTLKLGEERYSLIVALTSEGIPTFSNPTPGLKEIQLPRLTEISQGNVIFTQNPLLCYIDTINWSSITKSKVIFKEAAQKQHCGRCSKDCPISAGRRHCWGEDRSMCQSLKRYKCHQTCRGQCFKPGPDGCCHDQCAAGCRGSRDTDCFRVPPEVVPVNLSSSWTNSLTNPVREHQPSITVSYGGMELCREYRYKNTCISSCPSGTYAVAGVCQDIN